MSPDVDFRKLAIHDGTKLTMSQVNPVRELTYFLLLTPGPSCLWEP